MTNNAYLLPRLTLTTPAAYLIQVRGQTDKNWTEYFTDFSVEVSTHPDRAAKTILRGGVRDQAALLGMFALPVLLRCDARLGRMRRRVMGRFNYRHAPGIVITALVSSDNYDTASFKFTGTTTRRPYSD